jgi:hypothetical protein
MKLFDQIKLRLFNSAPVEKWTGSMNYPFNGHLDKPRHSLSKHEGTERGEGMLHCDDLIFILSARRDIPKLLEALDIAIEALKSNIFDSNVIDALNKIDAINLDNPLYYGEKAE